MTRTSPQKSSPEPGRVSLLLADDHPLFRKGLRDAIEGFGRYEILGEAKDGEAALTMIEQLKPRIALLDIDMPKMTGLQVAREVIRKRIETDLIVLTMHEDREIFETAMQIGVMGYILKDSAVEDILQCIETILAGRTYVSPTLTHHLVVKRGKSAQGLEAKLGLSNLTATERKILNLIARSRSTKQIAEELFISPKTVAAHRSNICVKLGLRGTNALLKFALERKDLL